MRRKKTFHTQRKKHLKNERKHQQQDKKQSQNTANEMGKHMKVEEEDSELEKKTKKDKKSKKKKDKKSKKESKIIESDDSSSSSSSEEEPKPKKEKKPKTEKLITTKTKKNKEKSVDIFAKGNEEERFKWFDEIIREKKYILGFGVTFGQALNSQRKKVPFKILSFQDKFTIQAEIISKDGKFWEKLQPVDLHKFCSIMSKRLEAKETMTVGEVKKNLFFALPVYPRTNFDENNSDTFIEQDFLSIFPPREFKALKRAIEETNSTLHPDSQTQKTEGPVSQHQSQPSQTQQQKNSQEKLTQIPEKPKGDRSLDPLIDVGSSSSSKKLKFICAITQTSDDIFEQIFAFSKDKLSNALPEQQTQPIPEQQAQPIPEQQTQPIPEEHTNPLSDPNLVVV